MGILSFSHWMVVLLAVFLLFGPKRIFDSMGDLGQGLGRFRRELEGGGERAEPPAPPVDPLPDAASAEHGASRIESE